MHYGELKEIIKYIKKAVPCSSCNKKLENEDITVLFTYGNESLLHVNCMKCSNQLVAHISIIDHTSEKTAINITTSPTTSIDHNDILEIHTFLNRFDGDFKQLFTECS
jgi:hypothetical protein